MSNLSPPARVMYLPGMPLGEFRAAELFVAASVRLWAVEGLDTHPGPSAWPDWRQGMAVAGLDDAATGAFDYLMRTITVCALRQLAIHPPPCPRLGPFEALVLDCLYLAQERRLDALDTALAAVLCPTGARLAAPPCEHLARTLASAGLDLGGPRRSPAHSSESMAYADRGRALVH